MAESEKSIKRLGHLLLEIGDALMSSGANTSRIRVTIERIASGFNCKVELLITNRALMLSLTDAEDQHYSGLKRTSLPGVNFRTLSGISRMSWRIIEEQWSINQVELELHRITKLSHYPRWIILLSVGLAGAGFCSLMGGHFVEMAITFTATICGLFVRQEAMKRKFNFYLSVFVASATSALLAGLAVKYDFGQNPDYALSTSVLYLVPGVPLINCFTDLIDGNIMNGVMRGINGLIISFAIALGLLVAFITYNIY